MANNMTAFDVLMNAYGVEAASKTIQAYDEIERNYILEKWKPSELDAGHFVESVRRIIEFELLNTPISYSTRLSNFNHSAIRSYEQATGHESFRILIPRILKSVYNIRNRRGVGHISDINPNQMDATFILHSTKWVLSEIVRLKSSLSIPDTQKLIDDIVEQHIPLIWKGDGIYRVLNTKLTAVQKIMIVLYDKRQEHDENLMSIIEYKNKSNFKTILRKLHKEKTIEYTSNGNCIISPKGIIAAEKILLENI